MSQTTRRLAAIMFADIVGYTAMMQRNEQEGLAKVRHFSAVIEQQVRKHEGEVLQFMGDGCLCVFHSAVQAMHAARLIQQDLKAKPQVPLRIGIHIGDIVMQEGNIYGDGVNLASRVESMGVPGSVLVTERVMHDLKSHPEFRMAPLGRFAFKNVEKPLEVYALASEGLAIPDPQQMQGKGEIMKEKATSQKSLFLFIGIGLLFLAIGAGAFWTFTSRSATQNQLLSDEIRAEKVAVSVFENFTGQENLDAFGYLGSEWISSGLRELKVRTVSPEMVRQNQDLIGVLPDNPDGKASFAALTGAKYVVTGSYFLKGDSIVLNTRLSSTQDGEDIQNFPKLIGHINEKEDLIEEARQYLLGFWVLQKDLKLPPSDPPKYEAYLKYLSCYPNQIECYQEVLALDPNFLLARVLRMGACSATGEDSTFYLDKAFVEQRWNKCTAFEKSWFRSAVYMWEGNYKGLLEAQEEVYRLDSSDYFSLHQAAFMALNPNNKPHLAIQKFDRLFQGSGALIKKATTWSYEHYLDALNRVKEYQKASDFYLGLSEEMKKNAGNLPAHYAMRALIHQNRIAGVQGMINQRKNKPEDYLKAAYIFKYIYPNETENPFLTGVKESVDQYSEDSVTPWYGTGHFLDFQSKATAYYVLGEWEKAQSVLNNMSLINTNFYKPYMAFPDNSYWEKLWHTALQGCIYAHLGNRLNAEEQIEILSDLGKLYDSSHAFFNKGSIPYLQARIYAVLGQKEKAVDLLKKSVEEGRIFGFWRFHFDLHLINLKGYEPFEELIKPKG